MSKSLWEILVPANPNVGCGIYRDHMKCHEAWDKKIADIAGSLSIMREVKGKWRSPGSSWSIESETMIAVRIACSYDELDRIIDMTKKHYKQKEVMVYLVSSTVIIR